MALTSIPTLAAVATTSQPGLSVPVLAFGAGTGLLGSALGMWGTLRD